MSQAKTETRINFRDELETEEYRVAAIRLEKKAKGRLQTSCSKFTFQKSEKF